MYFDYASSELKNEINDIFFISNAKFHIGTPSGLSFIPMIFNINTYWTNMNTVSQSLGFLKGDITIFKKIKSIKNKNIYHLLITFICPLIRICKLMNYKVSAIH